MCFLRGGASRRLEGMSYHPPIPRWLLPLLVVALAVAIFLAVWFTRRPAVPAVASAEAPVPALLRPAGLIRTAPALALAESAEASAPTPAPNVGPLRPAAERRRLAELERDNAELRRRLDEMLNWIIENIQGRYPLPEAQMKNLRVAPVDTNLLTSEDLIEILRLTPEEVERMDDTFWAVHALLQELADADMIILDDSSPERLHLHSPPYGLDGAEASAVLYDELLATLGKARFARFLQISADELNRQFDYFGDRDRILDFQLLTSDSGDAALFIADETAVQDPDDPMLQHISGTERVVDALPPEYAAFADRLPPLLAPFAE